MTSFRPLFFTRWHSAVGLGAAASIFTASGWALPASAKSANADESRDVKHKIVIIGGGAAGLGTASMLLRKGGGKTADVAIIEPTDHHYYQPYWTLVGGGKGKLEDSRRSMASVMPKEATWIKQGATAVDPDAQAVVLADGRRVHYEYLVVAAGIKVDMSSVKGLEATLGKNGVSTIYDYNYAGKAWDDIMAFKKGTALFTMPKTGVKCGGAPQKIMWLAEDYWRHEAKVRPDVEVEFVTGTGSMFGVPKYSNALEKVRIRTLCQERLISEVLKPSHRTETSVSIPPTALRARSETSAASCPPSSTTLWKWTASARSPLLKLEKGRASNAPSTSSMLCRRWGPTRGSHNRRSLTRKQGTCPWTRRRSSIRASQTCSPWATAPISPPRRRRQQLPLKRLS